MIPLLRKNLINTLDARLKDVDLADLKLSQRARTALARCRASTLYDAQMCLIDRSLADTPGVGQHTINEIEEAVFTVATGIRAAAATIDRKAQLIDDALDKLDLSISFDENYPEHHVLPLKNAIRFIKRYVSRDSKAYLLDVLLTHYW